MAANRETSRADTVRNADGATRTTCRQTTETPAMKSNRRPTDRAHTAILTMKRGNVPAYSCEATAPKDVASRVPPTSPMKQAEFPHGRSASSEGQPLPQCRLSGAEPRMPKRQGNHSRRPGQVVIEEGQRGNQGRGPQKHGLPFPPIAFIIVKCRHQTENSDGVVARMAKVHEKLRRPSSEQKNEEPQARMVRQVLAQDEMEKDQCQQPGKRMKNPSTELVDTEHGEPCRGDDVLNWRSNATQVIVQEQSLGPGHEIAAVPPQDVSLMQQTPGRNGNPRLIVPESNMVQVHQAQVRRHGEDAASEGRPRVPTHPSDPDSQAAHILGACPSSSQGDLRLLWQATLRTGGARGWTTIGSEHTEGRRFRVCGWSCPGGRRQEEALSGLSRGAVGREVDTSIVRPSAIARTARSWWL